MMIQNYEWFNIVFVLIMTGAIFIIYFMISYSGARREARRQEKEAHIMGLPVPGSDLTIGNMAKSSDYQARIKAIGLIAAELFKDMDRDQAIRMLTPFLSDTQGQVRAITALALYDYDKEVALAAVDTMAKSPEPQIRSSAVWVFSQLGTTDIIDDLVKLSGDDNRQVKDGALKGLRQVLQTKAEFLPGGTKEKIERVLNQANADDKV